MKLKRITQLKSQKMKNHNISDFNNNEIARKAYETIINTNNSIFLTGKAGTGKSTLLKCILEDTKKIHIVLAPTGVAAKNVDGVTLHSFFQLPFNIIESNFKVVNEIDYSTDKLKFIRELQLIVIDEISMVNSVMLDVINKILKRIRRNDKAFGGIQLLLIGDPFQLSPVVKGNDLNIIEKYWESMHFFDAKVFKSSIKHTFELTVCYRQSDRHFMNILDSIRTNVIDDNLIDELNAICLKNAISNDEDKIVITTRNDIADSINKRKLNDLNDKQYEFISLDTGNFNYKDCPAVLRLCLKDGAKVMFIKNNINEGYANGTMGKVEFVNEENIFVTTEEGKLIELKREEWVEYDYKTNPENGLYEKTPIAIFSQYPIRLGWAITANKSQGLTFSSAHLNFGNGAFLPGQTYVALSRCKELEKLSFAYPLQKSDIKVDQRVLDFYKNNLC